MTQTNIVMLALAPLIIWRVYTRIQRLTKRQKSHVWRHWTAVLVFPAFLTVLAVTLIGKPVVLATMLGGAALGALLGTIALRRTGFERVGDEYFFTPYAPIGMVISLLFIGRLLYRGFEFYTQGAQQAPDFGSSPLTLLTFGTVAGYYVVFGSGLLRWRSAERALAVKA